jgi:hypothetical protein
LRNSEENENFIYSLIIIIFRKKNIIDTMLLKIESYTNNLEELVKERTDQLEEERKRTETLLYSMLPV